MSWLIANFLRFGAIISAYLHVSYQTKKNSQRIEISQHNFNLIVKRISVMDKVTLFTQHTAQFSKKKLKIIKKSKDYIFYELSIYLRSPARFSSVCKS